MKRVKIKRFDGKTDIVEAYEVTDFPYHKLSKTKMLTKNNKKVKSFFTDFATLDIETTTITPKDKDIAPFGFMYHWQMTVAGIVCVGRTWETWLDFMHRLKRFYEWNSEDVFVIWVFNLGFEYQFIKDFLKNDFGNYTVFASKSRAPMRVECNGMEFRCAYFLTNMTLAKATENEQGVIHCKAVEDLDYRKIRTAYTKLSNKELGYCVSDVVSLHELIVNRLKNEHDNLETIPMTSTGYVRRDCRRACRKDKNYRKWFNKQTMTKEVYTLLKEAGRGGNTHANRYMSGRVWHDVDSFDVASSYPAQILLQQYPMTRFYPYGEVETQLELQELLNTKACLFRLILENVEVKATTTMPYIPVAKLIEKGGQHLYDNGRVLKQETLMITVTDIDFKIIEKQYTWSSMAVSDMYTADYGYLAKPIRDTVMSYFRAKTELKAKIEELEEQGNTDEVQNLQYLYAKSKNKLNAIFGMMYTDPVRDKYLIDDNGLWVCETADIEEALEHYNKSRNSFLIYAHGCWITAHARAWLEQLLDATGEGTIYCDTDSSKAVGVDIEKINLLNMHIKTLGDQLGAFVEINQKRYYLGVYEHENKEPIKEFKTLGAKKYCYTDEKGLHITVSGVNKKLGAKELKNIDNFRCGFIFNKAGGTTSYYNDENRIYKITINGCTMTTASNIGIIDSTYTLGVTDEYAEVLGLAISDL